jgi:hypothetical protein
MNLTKTRVLKMSSPHSHRTYGINENFFKTWTSEMAYVVGLWWADGCLPNKYRATITLHKNDGYLLEQIRKEIGSDKPIYNYKNASTLDMTYVEIAGDISIIGGKPNKSKNMNMPIGLPKKFIPDFIRGLWDGDGGMWHTVYDRKNSYAGEITSGDRSFLQNIKELLQKNISDIVTYVVEKRLQKNGNNYLNYGLRFSANNLRRLRDFMYANNPPLKMTRKYDDLQRLSLISRSPLAFEDGRDIVKGLGITTAQNYQEYVKNNKAFRLPVRPDKVYKNKGWISWDDWLGKQHRR